MATGQITITDLNDGGTVAYQYAAGTATDATGAWSATPPTITGSQYLWMRVGTIVPPATTPSSWDAAIRLTGAAGISAISGFLTNESHTVAADSDGTGYDLTGSGGTFKVYNGITDVTTASTFTGTSTSSGLTLTINASTGVYTLSGASWISENVSFTLTATYNSVTLTKVYTISKSSSGIDAEIYELILNPLGIKREKDGTLFPSTLAISAIKTIGNGLPASFAGIFKVYEDTILKDTSSALSSYNYTPSVSTVNQIKVELYTANGATLLDTQSMVILNDAAAGNLLYTNEWTASDASAITTSTFPHWTILDPSGATTDEHWIKKNVGPFGNEVDSWLVKINDILKTTSGASNNFKIDPNKKYRFSIYVKKQSETENNSTVHFGLPINTVQNVYEGSGHYSLTPPMFLKTDALLSGEWYLCVSYIYPSSYSAEVLTPSPDLFSGVYDMEGNLFTGSSTEFFRWAPSMEEIHIEFGQGLTQNGVFDSYYFYAPQVTLIDGTESQYESFFPLINKLAYLEGLLGKFDDDGIIVPTEKKSLFDLWQLTSSSYTEIRQQAIDYRLDTAKDASGVFGDYELAYANLKEYLEETLQIFDNMATNTTLPVDAFGDPIWSSIWNPYYTEKGNITSKINKYTVQKFIYTTAEIARVSEYVLDASGGNRITTIESMLTFDGSGLVIKQNDSNFTVRIDDDGIFFKQGDENIGTISENMLTIGTITLSSFLNLKYHTVEPLSSSGKNYSVIKYTG